MKLSAVSVSDAVIKWSLLAALFLTPIFFLPLTLYPVDLNKQFVFISLVFVAVVAWLVKAVRAGKLEYARSPANIPLIALVAFVIISAFFSGARHMSFMGQSGGETDTVIAVIGFAFFYFLIAATFKEKEDIRNAYIALMAGAFFVMVAALPAVIQAFAQFIGYPFAVGDVADSGSFNTVGTTNAFGLYAGLMAIFAFAGAQYPLWGKRLHRTSYALVALCLVVAFLIGYWATLVALAIVFFLFAVLLAREGATPRSNFVPLAVIIISLCMLVVGSGIVSVPLPHITAPPEVAPSVSASLRIAQKTARASAKNFLLGSGPATYQYEYGKYRDIALNQTLFWNVQFAQGFNAILTHLVSWGIIGTIIFLLFPLAIGLMLSRLIASRRAGHLVTGLTAASLYVLLALVVYPQNFTLYFFLFACAGMASAAYAAHTNGYRTISLASSPYGAFAWPLGMSLFAMAFVALLYINGRRFVAGVKFARGIASANETKDMGKSLPLLMAGVALDAENDIKWQALSLAYVAYANVLAEAAAEPTAESRKKITDTVTAAVFAAERATQVNPENAQNWIALAQIYVAAAPFNADALSSAFAVYGKAALLKPNDPAIPVYLGNAHVALADRTKDGNAVEYAAALASFEKALALKPDYAPAYFAIIRMFDREGRTEEAVARAERLRALASDDASTLLELGIMHYNALRMEKARDVLEQAVRIVPDYANALYFLGLVYERAGNHASALVAFEHVLKLNPKNAEIIAIVNNVRAGKTALTAGTVPLPPEIKK